MTSFHRSSTSGGGQPELPDARSTRAFVSAFASAILYSRCMMATSPSEREVGVRSGEGRPVDVGGAAEVDVFNSHAVFSDSVRNDRMSS